GAVAFRATRALGDLLREPKELRYWDEDRVIFLRRDDPRMLVVPREIARKDIREMLRRHLRPGDTFIDVGANHGSFSLLAAECLGSSGKIIAIEPQPLLASLVKKTLEANARCQFQVLEMACGDSERTAEFFVPSATSGEAGLYASIAASTRQEKLTVRVR